MGTKSWIKNTCGQIYKYMYVYVLRGKLKKVARYRVEWERFKT